MLYLRQGTYLYFNKFLDSISDNKMLCALCGLSNEDFVSCLEPPAVFVVHECLSVGFLVVQVAEDNGGRLNEEFAPCLVGGYFVAFCVDNLAL